MDNNKSKFKSRILNDLISQRIQLELLFSTGAIVTLVNSPDWITKKLYVLAGNSDVIFLAFYGLAQVFILAGINALIIGFTLNVFFRILTLCYLGIDHVFPEGMILEKLNFSKYIQEKIGKNKDTQNLIERSEQMAGFAFSFSILLVIKLLSLSIVSYLVIGGIEISGIDIMSLEYNKTHDNGLDNFVFLAVLIVLGVFDYIVFVLLRKFNGLSKVYYPIHLFFNYISLNFLTRKQKLILYSGIGRFKTNLIIIVFLFIGLYLSNPNKSIISNKRDFRRVGQDLKYSFTSILYDDERTEDMPITLASIPSKYISNDYIPLFCEYSAYYDYDLEKFYQPNRDIPIDSAQLIDIEDTKRLEALGKYFIVTVNDSIIQNLRWLHYGHPKTRQAGVLTHVPIKYLEEGQHRINVKLNVQEGNKYFDNKKARQIYINFVKLEN